MVSKLADAIGLKTHAVALTWADAAPKGSIQFKPGRWGCVVSVFATVAAKGRIGAFDRQTYGCWGGGVGLGLGNCHDAFPGGIEGLCRFLADGNELSEEGRRISEEMAAWGGRRRTDDFLQGERYLKSADVAKRFLEVLRMRDLPAHYVVVKPLDLAEPEQEDIKSVTLFVDPDRFSALVVLANYTDPDLGKRDCAVGGGMQIMGIIRVPGTWNGIIPAHWWG